MAKKPLDWDKARMMFELDKPLGEIEKATGINRGSLSRKAKKDGWEKGIATAVASQDVAVQGFKATLTQPQLHEFNTEVERLKEISRIDDYLNSGIGLAAQKGVDLIIKDDATMMDVVGFGRFQLDAKKGLGTLKEPIANNQKEEKTINNVMKVPLASDDWERAAIDSQSKLVNEQ